LGHLNVSIRNVLRGYGAQERTGGPIPIAPENSITYDCATIRLVAEICTKRKHGRNATRTRRAILSSIRSAVAALQ